MSLERISGTHPILRTNYNAARFVDVMNSFTGYLWDFRLASDLPTFIEILPRTANTDSKSSSSPLPIQTSPSITLTSTPSPRLLPSGYQPMAHSLASSSCGRKPTFRPYPYSSSPRSTAARLALAMKYRSMRHSLCRPRSQAVSTRNLVRRASRHWGLAVPRQSDWKGQSA